MPKSGKTKFEQDLKNYFPEMYRFWSLFSYDKYYNELIDAVLEMVNQNATGQIRIIYQRGKINYITQEKHLTAFKKSGLIKQKS